MTSDGNVAHATGDSGPLLLFDGVCNLCNATVEWVIERDTAGAFRFASLQSDAARQELASADLGTPVNPSSLDTIVLIDEVGIHTRSTAAIRIARRLGFPYSLLGLATVVPRPIRDAVYDFVARNRYHWFGRRDTCMVPTPDRASRFLDAGEPRPPLPVTDSPPEGEESHVS